MALICRQYELTTFNMEAIFIINNARTPVYVDLAKDRWEPEHTTLVNLLSPEDPFDYKIEDDIFAFMELRIDMLKPVLDMLKKFDSLYDQRITYNVTHNSPLKVEITYTSKSPIKIPEPLNLLNTKVYQFAGTYQLETEIPIITPGRNSSYPKSRKEVKKAVKVLEQVYRFLGMKDLVVEKSA